MILELKNSTIKFTSSDKEPTDVTLVCHVSGIQKQFQNYPSGNNYNAIVPIGAVSTLTNKFMIVDVSLYNGKVITFKGYQKKSTLTSSYCAWASALKEGETIDSLINTTTKIQNAVIVDNDSWYFGVSGAESTEYTYTLTIPNGAKYLITTLPPETEPSAIVRL